MAEAGGGEQNGSKSATAARAEAVDAPSQRQTHEEAADHADAHDPSQMQLCST